MCCLNLPAAFFGAMAEPAVSSVRLQKHHCEKCTQSAGWEWVVRSEFSHNRTTDLPACDALDEKQNRSHIPFCDWMARHNDITPLYCITQPETRGDKMYNTVEDQDLRIIQYRGLNANSLLVD